MNEYAVFDEVPVGPIERLREVEVGGYHSVLRPVPGVRSDDVIAMRRRLPILGQRHRPAKVLIVDRRVAA